MERRDGENYPGKFRRDKNLIGVYHLKNPSNIRLPSGNEAGAWPDYWIPGGHTSGGVPEAVVDQIKAGEYVVSDVYSK